MRSPAETATIRRTDGPRLWHCAKWCASFGMPLPEPANDVRIIPYLVGGLSCRCVHSRDQIGAEVKDC
ncbi:hypothetical protein RHECNPAF_4310052 [Rhizobium etli CNPAF512]|nr:hypothetical protein RHECNPAF_4310052 [Rhizobium etli CNPAF512]